jgi:hypothetical protein
VNFWLPGISEMAWANKEPVIEEAIQTMRIQHVDGM